MIGLDPRWAVALLIAAVACVTDLRTRRIPNVLTFGASALGGAYQFWTHGPAGLLQSAEGWLLGVALFLPLFLLRGMGGGDIKLLAALGAWLGPRDIVWVALYAAIAGGVMGVLLALWQRRLRRTFSNIGLLLWYWQSVGLKPLPELTLEGSRGPRLAYAVPIFAGAMLRLWWR